MLKELITLDQELLLALNGSDSLFMDGLMWTFTQTLTWVPLLVGIIYVLFQNQRPSVCFTIILTAILLVVFTDQFSSSLCKPYFHRLRPTRTPEIAALVDVVNGYRGGLYGFISSHAANTFGAAMFFTLVFRHAPTGLLLFCWAKALSACAFRLSSAAVSSAMQSVGSISSPSKNIPIFLISLLVLLDRGIQSVDGL